jgi:hypothetical protein
MSMLRASTVRFVTSGGVTVASTVTADKAQKCHRSHAGGTQNHAEYVEVHLSAHDIGGRSSAKPLIQESSDQNWYADSVLHVSVTQLNS